MMNRRILKVSRVFLLLFLSIATIQAQTRITTPKEQFGFHIGDDYVVVNYTQYVDYLKKLSRESDRLKVEEIGKSSDGRSMYLAIITSPENQKNPERYKEISRRLAAAEGLDEDQARALAAEGKAVVWIDGGLHATEVLGAQQLIENIYQLVNRTDPETMRLLNDVVILNCLVNPDGTELVSNWYMKAADATKRSITDIPRLYNKYAGHDDNRDFYMTALAETEAINRILFREWFPQIVYDHHQTGPRGAVMFSPPFRDPFNYQLDPLVITLLDEVGAAMHSRFAMEGKAGVTSRSGANYSTWWNGGLRTSPYFHNQNGLLTETIGNSKPGDIPFVAEKTLPQSGLVTATKFVNALIRNGVTGLRAASQFTVGGKTYPGGFYVIKTAQAFRPQVLDMFEPQDHPNDFAYAGAPPTPPYDIAGWTLAYQMGVKFDRILDAFDGPFQKVGDEVKPPAGKVTSAPNPAGYLFSHEVNDTFVAVNRLLAMKEKEDVYWLKNSFTDNGKTYPPGTQFIPAKPGTRERLLKIAAEIGVSFDAISKKTSGDAFMLRQPRIGLWDRYGGSIPSGWTRYVLEKFEFPYTVIYDDDLRQGDLGRKFDVLIFVNDAVINPAGALRGFLQQGGTILAIGRSTEIGSRLEFPIINALAKLCLCAS